MFLSSYFSLRQQLVPHYITRKNILNLPYRDYIGGILIHRCRVGIIINSSQVIDLGINREDPQIIIRPLEDFFHQSGGVLLIYPLPIILSRAHFFVLQGHAYDRTQYHPLIFMAQEIIGDEKYVKKLKGLIKFMKSPYLHNWRSYLRSYNVKIYILDSKS